MDAQSRRVLARVTAAYAKLRSLETTTRTAEGVSVSRLQRPRYYYSLQKSPKGQMVSLAVSDGRRYYEYLEATKRYLERDAAILDRVTLPTNTRFFFPAQKPGEPMVGLDGEPRVRDYAFTYAGREKVSGKTADVVRVATMVRTADRSWVTFQGTRYYDAGTGLLLRTKNGTRVVDVTNRPNPALPTDAFHWRPVPGAVKGFG